MVPIALVSGTFFPIDVHKSSRRHLRIMDHFGAVFHKLGDFYAVSSILYGFPHATISTMLIINAMGTARLVAPAAGSSQQCFLVVGVLDRRHICRRVWSMLPTALTMLGGSGGRAFKACRWYEGVAAAC